MDIFFFFYNIIITAAFAFCCIDFFVLYSREKDKSQLWIAIVFLLFVLDNLVLYMYEFLPNFSDYYRPLMDTAPYVGNMLVIVILFAYRQTTAALEKKSITKAELIFWALSVLVELGAILFYDRHWSKKFSEILLGIMSVAVFAHAIYRCRKIGGFPKRQGVPNIGVPFLMTSMILEFTTLVEKIALDFNISFLSPNRLLSIEIISVLYSATAIVFLVKNFGRTPANLKQPPIKESREELMKRFSDRYGLTQREREVLGYLERGCSNAQICQLACISEGTVKSHTHNIYQKLDINNRIQLSVMLKEFQDNVVKK